MAKVENRRFYDHVGDDDINEVISSDRFEELFSKIADLTIEYRNKNNGGLPKGIWLKLLELSGSYLCVEMIVKDKDGNLYLKKRNDPTSTGGEITWEGQLHIPGLSTNTSMNAGDMVNLLLKKEILKAEDDLTTVSDTSMLIGFVRYPEPERKTTADTLLFELVIDKSRLQDDFYQIGKGLPVIDQHKSTIEWYKKGASRPWVFDTRSLS